MASLTPVTTTHLGEHLPLLDLLPDSELVSWIRAGEGIVGWGVHATTTVSGPHRFADARKWWSTQLESFAITNSVHGTGTGPILFTSFSFSPFDAESFDVTTISFGLRNTVDYPTALAEALRVTKKGGRMVVIEFSHPTWAPFRGLYMRYLMRALPAIARKTASNPDAYVYLAESIRAWPDQAGLAKAMEAAGWSSVSWKNLTFGVVAVHSGIKG